MTESALRRFDAAAISALLLWTGAALAFGGLTAPLLFRLLPKDQAATLAGSLVTALDWAALAAFGLALVFAFGVRWISEIQDPLPLGPLGLWATTACMAMILTVLSATLITPRIRDLRALHQNQVSALPAAHPDRIALERNHKLSTQVFLVRLLLALGLAWGVAKLPRDKRAEA